MSFDLWLPGFVILLVVVQLGFWYWVSRPVRLDRDLDPESSPKPVSIIVCAKNEAANLRKNLPLLLQQNHPRFEVLVVDDHSGDDSIETVRELQDQYDYLRLETVPDAWKDAPGKKRALQFGLEQAKYDHVVLTDADCRPASGQWLGRMAAPLETSRIVLGYAPFEKERGWLNRWCRYENVMTGLLYLGLAKRGKPYMGVGRNLGYKRKWLLEHGGVVRKPELASGDDDLTIQALACAENTDVVFHPSAFMYSSAPTNWRAYWHQKARHLQTGVHYKGWQKALPGNLALSHVLVYAGLLGLLLTTSWIWAVGIWLVRCIAQISIFGKCFKAMRAADLMVWLPIADVFHLLYIVLATPLLFGKSLNKWK